MRTAWAWGAGFVCVGVFLACGSSDYAGNDGAGGDDSGVVSPGDSGSDATTDGSTLGDGGGGGDAGSDASSIRTPDQLEGLVVWIEASQVLTTTLPDGGQSVDEFLDHADAGRPFTHVNGSTPAALLPNALNDAPVADLHAFDMFAQTSGTPTPSFGTDPFVLEAVVSPGTCSSAPCPLVSFVSTTAGSDCNPVRLAIEASQLDAVFTCGTTHSVHTTLSAGAHLFGLERASATDAALRLDGVATALTLAGENMPLLPDLELGGPSDQMEQGIAELVVLRNPGAGDRDALEAYLKSKYGL